MANYTKITYEKIAEAADSLLLAGEKITTRAIRARIGDTGSMATIGKFLNEWKADNAENAVREIVLPTALNKVILDFIQSETEIVKNKLTEELEILRIENSDFAKENERLEFNSKSKSIEIDELNKAIFLNENRINFYIDENEKLRVENDDEQKEIKSLEKKITVLETKLGAANDRVAEALKTAESLRIESKQSAELAAELRGKLAASTKLKTKNVK